MHSPLRIRASKRTARRLGVRLLLSVPVALAAVPAVAHAGSLRLDTVGCQGVNGVTDNTFTVPAGVTSLSVTAHGAAGGGSTGGQGQWITGTISVSPGAKLYACVDEGGGVGGTSGTGPHGSNGGGYALLSNAQDFSSPYVIAGGGGGAGGATGLGVAGAGGRAAGSSAGTAGGDSGGGTGGQPADANGAGLKGENADNPLANGHNGVIRKGGKGGDGQNGGSGGGGGGGGVWGGGGGGASNGAANGVHSSAAGGGGGNSYCDMASCAYAYAGGGAYVDLTWVDPPATTTTSVSATTNPTPRDAAIEFEATISPVPSGGSVSFTMNGQLLQPCLARPVDTTTGKATCTYTAPPTSGTHTVKASYGGTTGFVASDDESSFTVSAPKATLSPGTVDFGAVTLGDKPTRTVTVSNTGTHDLSVFPHGVYIADTQGLALLGAPPKSTDFTVAADTCSGTTVAPGGTCTVSVAFKPTVVGARTAELLVDTDSETIVTELALNGTGKLPAPPEPETTPTPDPTPTPTPPVAPTPPAAPAEPAKAAPLKVAVSIPGVPKPSAKSKAALPVDPGKPLTVGCDTSAELDSCGVKLTVTVRGKQVVIGQATTKPGQQSVQIKLNATGRRLLADAPAGLKVRVAITGRSAEGVQTATASTTLVAKRTVTLLDGFAVNSAELSAKGRDFVDALARELKGDAPKRIVVTGHTDSSGPASDEYRKALGLSRAKAIAERLRERGVDSQFVTKSAADTAPAASEATAAGKAANRRVTLELQR